MSIPRKFAVIGAGIAGLSCAAALQQSGHAVRVFEKSRGAGGRMSTRRGEDWQCDHGAQYFTARDPDFREEVARWTQATVAQRWLPRLFVLDDVSARQSPSTEERFVGFPRMTAPAHFLAQGLNISAQCTVKQIERNPKGLRLLTAESGWGDEWFDAVLLAVPAPQVAPLLRAPAADFAAESAAESAADLAAEPAADLAAVAASAIMRGCWAMMLRFDAPIALPFDAAFVNAGPLRWIARDSNKPGRSGPETWLLHANAEWSERQLEAPAETVAKALLEAFRKLGGPPPSAWTAHRWRYADTEPAMDHGFVWNAGAGLGMCGDWLNGGKVEGAWLSGRALAKSVVSSHGNS
jgi:predicted NAD/FAD-dependent oxidoreductase